MIITKIYGGIGNQMFQYALARTLAIKNNTQLKFDIRVSEFSTIRKFQLDNYAVVYDGVADTDEIMLMRSRRGIFGLPGPNFLGSVHKRREIRDKRTGFNKNVLSAKDPFLLDGYWQSEKYFLDYRELITRELKIRPEFLSDNYTRAKSAMENEVKVSVHIRRGDYLSNGVPLASLDYYKAAAQYISRVKVDPLLVIFSDDIEWAKSNLMIGNRQYWIEDDLQLSDCESLDLMSGCDHHIIANSTFSWWGAWLGGNPDKIIIYPSIAKTHMPRDLMPESWLEM